MKSIFVLMILVSSSFLAYAQADRPIPKHSAIFIDEMGEDLDGFIRAEIVKKKLPLQIVLKREEADIIMTGSASGNEQRKWHEGWLTAARDHATGNVQIVDKQGKFLWATEAGDRSIWWGAMKRGGARQVANRIANNLRSAIADKVVETSPVANNVRPKDELRTTEDSPSEMSNLSGSYAGEVANTALGVSAPFAIAIREENGGIYGCTTVQRPLVGSGGFQGTVNGSKVVFEATGMTLRIIFIGELQGDALKGSYTVLSTQEHGEFQLRRENSKAPPVGFDPAQCRKD